MIYHLAAAAKLSMYIVFLYWQMSLDRQKQNKFLNIHTFYYNRLNDCIYQISNFIINEIIITNTQHKTDKLVNFLAIFEREFGFIDN